MPNTAAHTQPWEQGGIPARNAFISKFLTIASEEFVTHEGQFVKGNPLQA